jgi:hypothetical protein
LLHTVNQHLIALFTLHVLGWQITGYTIMAKAIDASTCVPADAKRAGKTKSGSKLERLCGMCAITMFSSCFYYSTLYPLGVVALLIFKGFTWVNAAWFLPCILSILLPAKPLPQLLALPFFKCILKYHEFEEVRAT